LGAARLLCEHPDLTQLLQRHRRQGNQQGDNGAKAACQFAAGAQISKELVRIACPQAEPLSFRRPETELKTGRIRYSYGADGR